MNDPPHDPRLLELIVAWEDRGRRASAEELCPHDPVLAAALRDAMRRIAAADALVTDPAAGHPPRIPNFRVTGPLGRGGMGEVWAATQVDPPRDVALKVIRSPLLVSRTAQRRFEREVKVLASFEHRNIARLYDSGRHEATAYIVMQRVHGVPLDAYCRSAAQPGERPADRVSRVLSLMLDVCDAVRYAHQKAVIHRDLKPSNVLVDGDGTAYVLDFGVARALGEAGAEADAREDAASRDQAGIAADSGNAADVDATVADTPAGATAMPLTAEGDRPGTLGYLPPEQADGDPARPDTRADVYALGVILYELLAGRHPYDLSGTRAEVLERIKAGNPPRPRAVNPEVPWELEAVTLRAMAHRPEDRYPTVDQLMYDLGQFAAVKPVSAVPPSAAYRLRKFVQRRRARLAAAVAAAAVAVTVSAWHAATLRAEQAHTRAERARGIAAATEAWRRTVDLDVRGGVAHWGSGDPARATLWFAQALAVDEKEGFRDRAWAERVRIGTSLRRLGGLESVAPSVESPVVSPDGTRQLEIVNDRDRHVFTANLVPTIGAAATTRPAPSLAHRQPINAASFSPDGTRVVTASKDATARVWDAATGTPVTPELRHSREVQCAAFSPDGRSVVTGGWEEVARVWDATTGAERPWSLTGSFTLCAAYSPDGLRIATGTYHGVAQVFDSATGKLVGPPLRHGDQVLALGFAPDGRALATGSQDGAARVWDAETGARILPPLRHPGAVTAVRFADGGDAVVTTCADGRARTWRIRGRRGRDPLRIRHPGGLTCGTLDPAGRIVTGGGDATVRTWDGATGAPVGTSSPLNGPPRAISADGRWVVTFDGLHGFSIWDATTGRVRMPSIQAPRPLDACFSRDGAKLWTGFHNWSRVWLTETAEPAGPRIDHTGDAYGAFSPDGSRLTTSGDDGTARVWDMAGTLLAPPLEHERRVRTAQYSADASRIVSASWDGTARVWRASDGAARLAPLRHGGAVIDASFSPDGRVIVTASEDRTGRLWDASTGRPLTPELRHDDALLGAAFSPDGRTVVTWGADRTARLWEVATGVPLGPPMLLADGPVGCRFRPDGRRLLSLDYREASLWDINADPRPAADLLALAELLAAERLDESGALTRLTAEEWTSRWEALRTKYPSGF